MSLAVSLRPRRPRPQSAPVGRGFSPIQFNAQLRPSALCASELLSMRWTPLASGGEAAQPETALCAGYGARWALAPAGGADACGGGKETGMVFRGLLEPPAGRIWNSEAAEFGGRKTPFRF